MRLVGLPVVQGSHDEDQTETTQAKSFAEFLMFRQNLRRWRFRLHTRSAEYFGNRKLSIPKLNYRCMLTLSAANDSTSTVADKLLAAGFFVMWLDAIGTFISASMVCLLAARLGETRR